jgi:hypothetical protein
MYLKRSLRWIARKYVVLVDRGNALKLRLPENSETPLRILVDSDVRGHAIVAGTVWVDTSESHKLDNFWADAKTGYMATKRYTPPLFRRLDINLELDCLAALTRVATSRKIAFYTCASLDSERSTQPNGRYRAMGWFDVDLFQKVDFKQLISEFDRHLNVKTFSNIIADKRVTLSSFDTLNSLPSHELDPEFLELRRILKGQSKEKDALHLLIAHKSTCPYFMTLDGPLLQHFNELGLNTSLPWLRTRVVKPSTLAKLLNIRPMNLEHLLLSEQNWFSETGSIPRPRSKNKRKGK